MNTKRVLPVLAAILALCFALTACGGAPAATTAPTAAPTAAPAAAPADNGAEGGGEFDLDALAAQIGTAAMGVTEAGETIYYAEAADSSFAILVFYDVQTNQNVSFVGPVAGNGTAITVTDYNNGLAFTFTMEAAEGDAVVIDTGDSGMAVMGECDPIEVLEAMQAISDYSDALM